MATVTDKKGYLHDAAGNKPYSGNQIGAYGGSYCERVYAFKVRPEGAKQVSIRLTYTSWGGGVLRCLINESGDMYTASTSGLSEDGQTLTYTTSARTATATITRDMIGGVTYYLHVFAPSGTGNYFVMYVPYDTEEANIKITEGDEVYGGLLRVWDENGTEHRCIPYVDDGTQWHQCLAFVDDGTAWHMGV